MKIHLKYLLIPILFGLLFFNCGDDVNQFPAPKRVELVAKSPEKAIVEHGIDAVPENDAIFLEWHPNSEEHLSGYAIYRSETEDKNFMQIGKVASQNKPIDTTFVDTSVSLNTRYFYFVRAYDEADQFSAPTDTVEYKLIEKPDLLYPIQDVIVDNKPNFEWENMSSDSFYFRMEHIQSDLNWVVGKTIKYDFPENWNLDEFGITISLERGRYQWRIDAVGVDHSGSESNWGYFIVN